MLVDILLSLVAIYLIVRVRQQSVLIDQLVDDCMRNTGRIVALEDDVKVLEAAR